MVRQVIVLRSGLSCCGYLKGCSVQGLFGERQEFVKNGFCADSECSHFNFPPIASGVATNSIPYVAGDNVVVD